MPPLAYSGPLEEARRAVVDWIGREPRARLVESDDIYLHAEFTSLLFRWVDDVELLFVPEEKLLHFRSASRVGHSDLGVNRRRMSRLSRDLSKSGFSPLVP